VVVSSCSAHCAMSSHPVDAALPPHTFSSLLNSLNAPPSQQQTALQRMQQMHSLMMAHQGQQIGTASTMLPQQPDAASCDSMNPLPHQAHPAPFPFMMPPSLQFPLATGAASADASTFTSMRAPAMWQHMCNGSSLPINNTPLLEGMLKNWSQGLLAAASAGAGSSMYNMFQQLQQPTVGAKQRKPKKATASCGEKKQKQQKQPPDAAVAVDAAAAVADAAAAAVGVAAPASGACRDDECKESGSALCVLSAAVDIQGGDRDEASLNAANALHDMLGGWDSSDDMTIPELFALQAPLPRMSKKRNRSLLKELAVSVVEQQGGGDDDQMALTPGSKGGGGRSCKQLDSAYNHTTNPEHVCRTKDGAPVVDVHVPALCECGSVVVGVWYRNRPHYCRWFRHARYAALRALLEQNRRKNKSRPVDDRAAADTPGGSTNNASASSETPVPRDASSSATFAREPQSTATAQSETWGCKTSAEELLAPKFLSLLCLFQFVKHDDAVELVYPRGILGNTMTKPQSLKISSSPLRARAVCAVCLL